MAHRLCHKISMNVRLAWPAILSVLLLPLPDALAQESEGKWSLGVQGGVNLFLTDFNERRIGPGATLSLRYGVTPAVSLGLTGGYEELKTKQTPQFPFLPYDYVKLHAFPVSFNVWVRLLPGRSVSPYLYAGAGVLLFKRRDGGGSYFQNESLQSSPLIPVGVGLEVQTSRRSSLSFELGYHLGDDRLETYEYQAPDAYATAKVGMIFFLGSGSGDDDDNDGLTNQDEERIGTDPRNPDTEGDGLADGEEIRHYKTNPLQSDTDADGLADGEEATRYRTDPARSDTDADGLMDGDEALTRGTDPLKADTDGDGLTDGEEVLTFGSDPLKTDSDGDGIADGDEVNTFRSNPAAVDTDGDGIPDGDEVNIYRSDPTNIDTDGGGAADGIEVGRKSNPLNPRDDMFSSPMVLERGATVILEGVTFETGSAYLTRESAVALEKAFVALVANPSVKVEIAGYTDNVGRAEGNEKISLRRAEAVKVWLVRKGISALRLSTVGWGMKDPIASNDTAEGRTKNRRIEFRVLE